MNARRLLLRGAGAVGLLACLGRAGASRLEPSYGQHGMVLFGGADGLYASHLPMLHAPHDRQVILQIRLADKALDAALRRRLDGKTALWTIAPENFELDRLAPDSDDPLRAFKADLVQGHFERGGATQHKGTSILVEKVLLFRPLLPRFAVSTTARYLQVGGGATRFLVKQIDSRPDFDHIVAFRTRLDAPHEPVEVPKKALEETPAAALARQLRGARILGTIYFDKADLA
ncbi:hypothetical protein PO883_17615 [Massilia sp. DJPM01]|uniref:hypothetical protein n=1 Tax=Massilia sp. DJPM01 TaxID=3024404 RepID=UPI00259D50C3|nr:hypothetical protein [Massilia sp. DJPM01]MDM5179017.1 hypothetical protein [Massilia sp. DJPM01]